MKTTDQAVIFQLLRDLLEKERDSGPDHITLPGDYVRKLVESLYHIFLTVSPEGVIKSVNPYICNMLGYGEDELLALPLETILEGGVKSLSPDFDADSSEAGKVRSEELVYLTKDGEKIPVSCFSSFLTGNGREPEIVCIGKDISEQKAAEAHLRDLEKMSTSDHLTGLPNRALFFDRLAHAINRAKRQDSIVVLIFVDVDNFKAINDTLGHDVGDKLLMMIAKRLKRCLRESDTVARIGGDEFTIIAEVPRQDFITSINLLANKIVRVMDRKVTIAEYVIPATVSMGVSVFPFIAEDVEMIIKTADIAMYEAKKKECNSFEIFSKEMQIKVMERKQMEDDLRSALKNEEFVLYYQPQIDLKSGLIVGAEALLRWMSPEAALLPPTKFIPLLEETGLIISVGEWVLHTACVQNKAWQAAGFPPLCMAVNLSALQFQQNNLVETVDRILEDVGLDPEYLELEITESVAMRDVDSVIARLHKLKELGLRLSIDDFGTGYSSLSYLQDFPVDKLKIDKRFVDNITVNKIIPKVVIDIARDMNFIVIAEGVETEEQQAVLKGLGCDEAQGYYLSRPLSHKKFEELLESQRNSLQAGK